MNEQNQNLISDIKTPANHEHHDRFPFEFSCYTISDVTTISKVEQRPQEDVDLSDIKNGRLNKLLEEITGEANLSK